MNFLDNQDKKRRGIKLAIYYASIFMIVVIVTTLLVFQAKGYDIDHKTRDLIRNGIVYISSNPKDAEIFINGQNDQNKTEAKLALPEGRYSLELRKDGYNTWSKSQFVQGGLVHEIAYPKLFPEAISYNNLKGYGASGPSFVSQSTDYKWILVQSSANQFVLDIYETSKPNNLAKTLVLPTSSMTLSEGKMGTIKNIEWSSDNKKIILQHVALNQQIEYIVLDREEANSSVNVSKQIANIQSFGFFGQESNKFIALLNGGQLVSLEQDNLSNQQKIAEAVSKYAQLDNKKYLVAKFVANSTSTIESVGIVDEQKYYKIEDINGDLLSIDLAAHKYDDNEFYFVANRLSNTVKVLQNPLDKLKNNQSIDPENTIKLNQPQLFQASADKRYLPISNKQVMIVYDTKLKKSYRYTNNLIASSINRRWIDNSHFAVSDGNGVYICEYDGENIYTVAGANQIGFVAMDVDDKYLYTFRSELLTQNVVLSAGNLIVK